MRMKWMRTIDDQWATALTVLAIIAMASAIGAFVGVLMAYTVIKIVF
jgi:hypothetical protein